MRLKNVFLLYARRWFWAYAAFGLSLTACAAPTPAPPTPAPILIQVSDVTAPLLDDLAEAYTTATVQASPNASLGLTVGAVPPGYFATPVGLIDFVVVVHPANPLTSLTLTQTRAILLGDLTDWAQVSPGLSGVIQVVSREDEAEAAQALRGRLLENALPTRAALLAPSWAAMREIIGGDTNTLGYLPRAEVDASVKALDVEADLQLPLVAMSATEPSGPARDFLAWLQSPTGQAVVAQKYTPLRTPPE
jgi:ABC-type phosphate transport system substrate-binding protein